MNTPSSIPASVSNNSRMWRGDRLAPLAALLILMTGFSTTWVSASREHPARVSFMDGRAAYESSGDVDWNEVTLNLPLVSGDRIVAHPDSRIEVELGDGNFVRISGETDVFFSELSQKENILKIHQGDLILRVNDGWPDPCGDGFGLGELPKERTLPNPGRSRRFHAPGGPQGPGGSQQSAREGESGDRTRVASGRTAERNPGAGSGSGRFRALERAPGRPSGEQSFHRLPGGCRLRGSPFAGPSWPLV